MLKFATISCISWLDHILDSFIYIKSTYNQDFDEKFKWIFYFEILELKALDLVTNWINFFLGLGFLSLIFPIRSLFSIIFPFWIVRQ